MFPAALLLLVPFSVPVPALGQSSEGRAPAPASAPAAARAHARAAPNAPRKPATNDFDVVGWLMLTPTGNSLIRAPNQQDAMDLTARDDDTYVTVYGRKKRPDVGPRPDTGYAPADNDAGIPNDVRYLPPGHCANAAYNTVAGQPATDQDLIGFLGSGAGC